MTTTTSMFEEKEILSEKQQELFAALMENDRYFVVQELLDVVNPNSRDELGYTPLHYAARNVGKDTAQIVALLISKSANINAVNAYGLPPLHQAARNLNLPVIKLLCAHESLIPTIQDNNGCTPLHYIVKRENESNVETVLESIRTMLAAGVPIDAIDNEGNTALHVATRYENKNCIQLLIANGASVTIRNNGGKLASEMNN